MKTVLKHSLHQRKVIRMCVPTEMDSSMILRNQGLELLDMKRKAGEKQIPKNPFYLFRYDVAGSWLTRFSVPGGVLLGNFKGDYKSHYRLVHSFSLYCISGISPSDCKGQNRWRVLRKVRGS